MGRTVENAAYLKKFFVCEWLNIKIKKIVDERLNRKKKNGDGKNSRKKQIAIVKRLV